MKYEFGVACTYHMAGGKVSDIGKGRFPNYASAKAHADKQDDCDPTIYIIIDDKYAFFCEPYAPYVVLSKNDVVPYVYSIESKPWGQIETRIWWKNLIKNPSAFYHLAEGIVGG